MSFKGPEPAPPSAQLLTQIDYNWRLDNTIDSRTETDATVQPQSVATVTFEYDNRHRLTRRASIATAFESKKTLHRRT